MGFMEDNKVAQPREKALGRIPGAYKASGETELWRLFWRLSWQPATANNTKESWWKALMEGSRLWQGRSFGTVVAEGSNHFSFVGHMLQELRGVYSFRIHPIKFVRLLA